MKLIFPYFIILVVIFQFFLRKGSKRDEERTRAFWKREAAANAVRKKDISNLNYIKIPDSLLKVTSDVPATADALAEFCACKDTTMLNLTGLSNTDLKMEYGPANLEVLSAYDENCSRLLRSIVTCAECLKNDGRDDAAVEFLTFGISCNTDITANYTMLAEFYAARDDKEGIDRLIQSANSINSITKDIIQSKLRTYL